MTGLRLKTATGSVFILALAAVFANLWLASSPLPLGGPNVVLAGAAIVLAVALFLVSLLSWKRGEGKRFAVNAGFLREFRPVIPALVVSALIMAWALAVYLLNDSFDATRFLQMFLGVGLLFAVYLSVDSAQRARLMVMAIVVATFVSALFGIAVALFGDPFLTVWLQIASVRDKDLELILTGGRIAGLAAHTGVFGYQLAAAVPLAFAALLLNPFGRDEASRRMYDAGLFVMLMTLLTALVMNATRSAILGVVLSAVVIAFVFLRGSQHRRRILVTVPLGAVWLFAFFNPVYGFDDLREALFDRGEAAVSEDGGDTGDRLVAVDSVPTPVPTPVVPGGQATPVVPGGQATPVVPGGQTTPVAPGGLATPAATPVAPGSLATPVAPGGQATPVAPPVSVAIDKGVFDGLSAGPWGLRADRGATVIGHTFMGMAANREYAVQLRARMGDGYGAPSAEITNRPNEEGGIVLTWREPEDAAAIIAYQFRLRPVEESRWLSWRDFTPTMSSLGPSIDLLSIAEAASSESGGLPVIRHSLVGLVPGLEYRAQMRARNRHGFGATSRETAAPADENGDLALAWREPESPEAVTAYEFRLWSPHFGKWLQWQGLAPSSVATRVTGLGDIKERIAMARTALEVSAGETGEVDERGFNIFGWSAGSRIHQMTTALRYHLDYPLGTGVYAPSESHTAKGLSDSEREALLLFWPHNQFLHFLTLYGLPGLILLILFYGLVIRSVVRSGRLVLLSKDAALRLLMAAVAGALMGYTITSLFTPSGPFIVDWNHFFILGLAFAIHRIAVARKGSEEPSQEQE